MSHDMSEPVDPMHAAMLAQMQNLEAFKQATDLGTVEAPPSFAAAPSIDGAAHAHAGLMPPQIGKEKSQVQRLPPLTPRAGAVLPPGAYMALNAAGALGPGAQRPPMRPPLRPIGPAPNLSGGDGTAASSSALPRNSLAGSPEYEKSEREKFINFVNQHREIRDRKDAQAEKAKRDAVDQAELDKLRCHLHKKVNQKCKFCKRFQECVDKKSEENAAADRALQQESDAVAAYRSLLGGVDELELANPKTFGFPALFQVHIVDSVHFKSLAALETCDQVVEEIKQFAESIEPYMPNSSIVPTPLFGCLYRLFTMGLNQRALVRLLDDEHSYVRCVGLLFVRFGLPPEKLWSWLEEYIVDEKELRPSKDAEWVTTIGEFVESLLSQERYYSLVLPRLPVSTKRQVEAKLAQVPQFRKRAQANQRLLDVYHQPNVKVSICDSDGNWVDGISLYLDELGHRQKLHVRLDDGTEQATHIGKVILADSRFGANNGYWRPRKPRSRSRSLGQVDWSRQKGKTGAQLVDELRRLDREKAVCSSGKDYAKKPLGFKAACALPREMGVSSQRLMEDETFVPVRRDTRRREPSPEQPSEKRVRHSAEYQAQMQQLFEKYGMAKGSEASAQSNMLEGPDVMRLG